MDTIFWTADWWQLVLWIVCYFSIGGAFMSALSWYRGTLIPTELKEFSDGYGDLNLQLVEPESWFDLDAKALEVLAATSVIAWPLYILGAVLVVVIGAPVYGLSQIYDKAGEMAKNNAKKKRDVQLHNKLLELEKLEVPTKNDLRKIRFLRRELNIND